MIIRKTAAGDIPAVLSIYEDARRFMRENGNLTQWAGGYPQKEIIEEDVENGISYVVEDNSEIVCVFALLNGPDPTYSVIYDGQWPNENNYKVIHRIAVSKHQKGIASFVFNCCIKLCSDLRIDTHRDNIPMQNALKKSGFEYCGIIHLANGDERLAYNKHNEEFDL